MIGSRTVETGDADVVLAGGVESMTRAPWVLPKPDRAFPARQRHRRLDDARLAAGQPADAGRVDRVARRGQRAARRRSSASPASGRTSSPPARTGSPHAAWDAGFYDDLVVAGAGRGPGPRRGHPRRLHGRDAGRAQAVVPHATAPSPPATPRRSTTAPPPCCSARPRPPTCSAATRSPGSPAAARPRWSRRTSAIAPVEAANQALPRAGIGWADVGAVELNEAFAVQSLACVDAWEHRPRDREHPGRRDRDRPPARRLRRPDPRHAGQGAARGGHRWGVAAICIGVGQGLAVVLENVGMTRDRIRDTDAAVAGVADGATVLVGGFGRPASRSS